MDGNNLSFADIIEKCDFALENNVFSKEELMKIYSKFLECTVENNDGKKISVVMHTGSICFEAFAVLFGALSCLFYDENSAEDVIRKLNSGDIVIFGKEKYYFREITELNGRPAVLLERIEEENKQKNEQKIKRYLPINMWNQITPYYGNARSSGSRGLKKHNKKRDTFYEDVFEADKNAVPSVIGSSVVIVMPKEKAKYLFENLSIFCKGNEYKLNELVTASYYSGNKEYQIGANESKNESVLQFTSQLYVAGNRLRDRHGNVKLGIIISGDDTALNGMSEIPGLVEKRSLKYSTVIFNIDSKACEYYLDTFENSRIFPCTRDFILYNSAEPSERNRLTLELASQRYDSINKTISTVIFKEPFTWKRCSNLKRKIKNIRNYDFESEEKKRFVVQSFALINLILTAVFDISVMDLMIKNEELDILSIEKRLSDIRTYANTLPSILVESANSIIDELETMYLELLENNYKYECLKRLIVENRYSKIAVIVPKGYYINIMRKCGYYDLMTSKANLIITTPNRFNKHDVYNLIIVIGDIEGKNFDIFRCQCSERFEVLLYECEEKYFRYHRRRYEDLMYDLNKSSFISVPTEEFYSDDAYDEDTGDEEINEIERIDADIEHYTTEFNMTDFNFSYTTSRGQSNQESEVVAVAVTENGEKAFFTKNYRAYVYSDEEIKKTSIDNLSVGDVVLFTVNNSETADIVDLILKRRLKENKYPIEALQYYRLSKRWKDGLRQYVQKLKLKEIIIAKAMVKSGINVEPQTIVQWLDEGSRTVGPRDPESIRQIGRIIKDEEMEKNYIEHYYACNEIRKIHKKILKEIANVIILRVSGRTLNKESEFYDIYERLESQSELVTIKLLNRENIKMPTNMVNRLINQ